jgi:hypothetical protein
MPTVAEQASLPADVDPSRCAVEVQLYQADRTPLKEARDTVTGETVVGRRVFNLDGTGSSPAEGAWSLVLPGNTSITPSGTVWGRTLSGPRVVPTLSYATVPASAGPYQWKVIETDPPAAIDPAGLAAHAADTGLHSGGRRLGIAHLANQLTASTSFVDLPGATLTLTNPTPATFDLILDLPVSIETSGQYGEFQILAGSTVIGVRRTQLAQAANQSLGWGFRLALPSTLYTPVAEASVTYKVQWRSSLSTSDVAIVTEFGVPINTGYFEAVRA